MAKTVKIADFKYDMTTHKVAWILDQSSSHKAIALNVNKMNALPGLAQAKLRGTAWGGQTQKKRVPEERGINVASL
jgi:hypothetical protein